jgi:hypothetical protein
MRALTDATISPINRRQHDNSVASIEHHLPPIQHVSNPKEDFEQFSNKLMKNKTLVVPRRLALKRQRAPLKPTAKKLAPLYTDSLQMELGNPEELALRSDHGEEDLKTMISNIHSSVDHNHSQSISNHSSPRRDETPHTVPADISLLYRYIIKFSYRRKKARAKSSSTNKHIFRSFAF